MVWAGLLLIFIRGIATFILPAESPEPAPIMPAAAAAPEPPGLRSFPALFTTDYLTWTPNETNAYVNRLKPYLARGLDLQPGWKIEPSRPQRVTGAWVHGVEAVNDSHWRVTVAARVEVGAPAPTGAQVQPTGQASPQVRVLYLSVPVAQADNAWIVYDLPTVVPAPERAAAQEPMLSEKTVSDTDGSVHRLLSGFFQAYTRGTDVSYFLVPGVTAPRALVGFELDAVGDVAVVQSGADTWALAEVRLKDALTGAVLTTRYTVQITQQTGRWYIQTFAQGGA